MMKRKRRRQYLLPTRRYQVMQHAHHAGRRYWGTLQWLHNTLVRSLGKANMEDGEAYVKPYLESQEKTDA